MGDDWDENNYKTITFKSSHEQDCFLQRQNIITQRVRGTDIQNVHLGKCWVGRVHTTESAWHAASEGQLLNLERRLSHPVKLHFDTKKFPTSFIVEWTSPNWVGHHEDQAKAKRATLLLAKELWELDNPPPAPAQQQQETTTTSGSMCVVS